MSVNYSIQFHIVLLLSSEKLFSTPFVIPIWMPINIDVATGVENEPPEAFDMVRGSSRSYTPIPLSPAIIGP